MTREEHLDKCLVQANARIKELEQILKAQCVAATNDRIAALEEAARDLIGILPYLHVHPDNWKRLAEVLEGK